MVCLKTYRSSASQKMQEELFSVQNPQSSVIVVQLLDKSVYHEKRWNSPLFQESTAPFLAMVI